MESTAAGIDAETELIETLWNVNQRTTPVFPGRRKELIETLWNVNDAIS